MVPILQTGRYKMLTDQLVLGLARPSCRKYCIGVGLGVESCHKNAKLDILKEVQNIKER